MAKPNQILGCGPPPAERFQPWRLQWSATIEFESDTAARSSNLMFLDNPNTRSKVEASPARIPPNVSTWDEVSRSGRDGDADKFVGRL